MDKDDRIKVNCPNCGEQFFVVRNTRGCPHCEIDLSESVEDLFAKLDTNIANSKGYQFRKTANNVGEAMQKTGSGLQNCGCTLILLPLALFSFLFLLSMCGANF